jgi:hypothetical protein
VVLMTIGSVGAWLNLSKPDAGYSSLRAR